MSKSAFGGRLFDSGRHLVLITALCFSVLHGVAQRSTAPPLSNVNSKPQVYDVASIKLNKTGNGHVSVRVNDNLYDAINVSVKGLVAEAYAVREDLVSGVDGLVASARFDISAKIIEPDLKAMESMSDKEQGAMLLPMLQERFKLQAHTETKMLPVYELVLIKGGPRFKASAPGDTKEKGTHIQNRELEAGDVTMESMAKTIANQVHRTVIDKTGLKGSYDLSLKWSREDGVNLDDGTKDSAPPIFTALEEQLGLKLVPAKGPVETVVVDRVEMPTEN